MAEENVVFQLQVDKKLLEQVFNENKHLKDSYNKLFEKEETIKTLKDRIGQCERGNANLQKLNKELNEENILLRTMIRKMEETRRIDEEKQKCYDLGNTESKLLKMKLQKLEIEKIKIVEQYEKETEILDKLLRDKSKLEVIQEQLDRTTKNVITLNEELKNTKNQLINLKNENKRLDEEKLNLELQIKNLTRKVRLDEERNKSNDLAHVECKLSKLKLHTLENEKKYLIEEFEREKRIITKQNKPRVVKLEENLTYLRRWIEKEARERRPHDTEEVKALKAQIQILERDKIDLIEGFELERKVFQKILKSNGN